MRLSRFGERLRQDPPRWTEPSRGLLANFRYGDLSPSDFPILAWKKAMVSALNRRPERLAYDDPCGSLRLRTALQGYLWRSRSVRCDVDQIVVVNGSQQGLDHLRAAVARRRRSLRHGGSGLPDGEAHLLGHRCCRCADSCRQRRSGDGAACEHRSPARLCDAVASISAGRRLADRTSAPVARMGGTVRAPT